MVLYRDKHQKLVAIRKQRNNYEVVRFVRPVFGKGFIEAETIRQGLTLKQIKDIRDLVLKACKN